MKIIVEEMTPYRPRCNGARYMVFDRIPYNIHKYDMCMTCQPRVQTYRKRLLDIQSKEDKVPQREVIGLILYRGLTVICLVFSSKKDSVPSAL